METPPLKKVNKIIVVKGRQFPADVDIHKLIITGPPGSGKTTILSSIGGWPEEGYLDISSPNWWKSSVLGQKPRELHLGMPFVGYVDAVPVYDIKTLDDPRYLELDLLRIHLPPPNSGLLAPNFRRKIIFEFLLPLPKVLFERRQKRQERLTHHVDQGLTLDQVQQEYNFLITLAHFFHASGMNIYIRQDSNGPPMRFDEVVDAKIIIKGKKKKDLQHLHGTLKLKQRILNRSWSFRGNKELLELFVYMLPGTLQVERCNIFINDPTRKEAWLLCGTSLSGEQVAVSQMQPLVNEVISSGEYFVQEGLDSSEFAQKNNAFALRNTLIVPIKSISGTNQTGAIQALNKTGGRGYFEENDRLLLEKVAIHLQLAFENVFLRREMMDLSEILSLKGDRDATKNKIIIIIVSVLLILSAGINFFTYHDVLLSWLSGGN